MKKIMGAVWKLPAKLHSHSSPIWVAAMSLAAMALAAMALAPMALAAMALAALPLVAMAVL